jgi:hypothetical protein
MKVGLGFAVLTLVIYVLAVARLTRLINFDTILDKPRIAVAQVFGIDSAPVYFVGCPWCVGMWLSLFTAIVPTRVLGLQWWWFILIALATSHLVGVAAALSSDEEMAIEDVVVD